MKKSLNKVVKPLIQPVQEFITRESSAGAFLFVCTIASLTLSQSALKEWYVPFWQNRISVFAFNHGATFTLEQWINDGLMAVFFLYVGLGIKQELVSGVLSSPKKAALPLLAAVGGMIVPALIFMIVNSYIYNGAAIRTNRANFWYLTLLFAEGFVE